MEAALFQLNQHLAAIPQDVKELTVNPTLQLLPMRWGNLTDLLPLHKSAASDAPPELRDCMVLLWRIPRTDDVQAREASDEVLLVLKMIVEKIDRPG